MIRRMFPYSNLEMLALTVFLDVSVPEGSTHPSPNQNDNNDLLRPFNGTICCVKLSMSLLGGLVNM